MRRREFITLAGGGGIGRRLVGEAKRPVLEVLGFLHPTSSDTNADRLRGFHRGMKEIGYVEGDNLTIVYSWAESQIDRLPALADELVRRQVDVIAAIQGH